MTSAAPSDADDDDVVTTQAPDVTEEHHWGDHHWGHHDADAAPTTTQAPKDDTTSEHHWGHHDPHDHGDHHHHHHNENDVDDFDEEHYGYEFIYHDYKDLLLTIHHDNCYFIMADDEESERFLSDEKPLGVFPSPRHALESYVRWIIHENSHHHVHESDLNSVGEFFHDLAANKKCVHNKIYRIDFNWKRLEKNDHTDMTHIVQ